MNIKSTNELFDFKLNANVVTYTKSALVVFDELAKIFVSDLVFPILD